MRRPCPNFSTALGALLGLLFLATAPLSADWPRYRGDGTGVVDTTGLLRSWGDDGPQRLWHRAIGDGFSGMAVVDDHVYTIELRDGEQRLVSLNAATGETVWAASFGTDYQDPTGFGNGARSTPTVDGDNVYAVSADSILIAADRADGKILWRNDFKESLGTETPRFGFGSSPLIDGDRLIIEAGGQENRAIVALDKKNGDVLWAAGEGPASYATPLPVTIGETRQLILNRRSGLVGLDAEDGTQLWEHPSAPDTIVVPIFVAPDRLFISSAAMGDGGHMIRIAKDGESWKAEKVWSNHRFRNHFNTSVLHEGYFYGFDNATLRCVDAETGENVWAARGYGKGSLVAADDLLFVLSDRGLLALVEASPEGYKELGRVQALDGRAWTSPSLANGRLFIRDMDEIAAYAIGGGRASAPRPKETTKIMRPVAPEITEDVATIVARYTKARGGADAWAAVKTLSLKGNYATFSTNAPFTEIRQRGENGDHFRLEVQTLAGPATWARDDGGPWWIFPMVGQAEPSRLTEGAGLAYARELERRSKLEPLLIGYEKKGLQVELAGWSNIADQRTIAVKVKLGEDHEETWHLDPKTGLEVAVDATIFDYSQGRDAFEQRIYYSDFRQVGDVVVPHRISSEFGARLEDIHVDEIQVNGEIDPARFTFPEPAEDAAEAEEGNAEDAE